MLFKRYADPLSLMSTYSLQGLADFILQLFDEENESQLWEVWLHKDVADDFETFKKKHYKKSHKRQTKALSIAEEKDIIEKNIRFIKPRKEGGES